MTLTDLLRLAQSGARGFTTGLLGAPVDIANTMMGGVGGPKPVMGGEWIGDKLQGMGLLAPPAEDLPNAAAEFAGGLLNPGGDMALAAKAAAGTKGLLGAHIVFHGSPHTFDKFDLSKIGTGEGAQAYGHGLYFADNPQVAADYQRMLAGKHGPIGADRNGGFAESAIANMFLNRKAAGLSDEVAREQTLAWASKHPQIGSEKAAQITPKLATNNGNLYKVDIPDEAIGKMLDWDKPLSEQPQAVKDALEKGMPELYRLSSKWDSTAAGFVDALEKSDGRAGAAAKLRSLGIPGIRYLDQGSRASGKGTYNTVLFDADLAKILSRE